MRKLVLILLGFIAVVTFLRAWDTADDAPSASGTVLRAGNTGQ